MSRQNRTGKQSKSIADQLRERIAASGITGAQIARTSGVSKGQVSRFTAGKTKSLSSDNLEKIANAVGLKLEFRAK